MGYWALTDNRGAYSVGAHLVANDGDNEGLFRAGELHPRFCVGPIF